VTSGFGDKPEVERSSPCPLDLGRWLVVRDRLAKLAFWWPCDLDRPVEESRTASEILRRILPSRGRSHAPAYERAVECFAGAARQPCPSASNAAVRPITDKTIALLAIWSVRPCFVSP